MNFEQNLFLCLCACTIDRIIGDPHFLPHSVKLFGHVISLTDRLFNKHNKHWQLLNGTLLAVILPTAIYFLIYFILKITGEKYETIFWFFAIFFAGQCLSYNDLKKECLAIKKLLDENNIEKARLQLSRIVGRDTNTLDENGIKRATIECIAESTCDGIISPLFYLFLGGLPVGLAFKSASTLDSMIGYRNERYEYFGKTAARLDDVLNFIPSKLTALLIAVSSPLINGSITKSLSLSCFEGHKHKSPNAGYPEAAMAGALLITLGGSNSYAGKKISGHQWVGGDQPLQSKHITQAIFLSSLSQVLALGIFYCAMISL